MLTLIPTFYTTDIYLLSDVELKQRIEAFVQERRKTGGNQTTTTTAPVEEKMDVV